VVILAGTFTLPPGRHSGFTTAWVDKVLVMWQNLDRDRHLFAISGTGTFLNDPPSANTTLDTVIDLGYAAVPPTPMRDLMSTTDGPFCYFYL